MSSEFFGLLAAVTLALMLVFAAIASVHVTRMRNRTPAPMSVEVGSIFGVMKKLRNNEPLSKDESDLARQAIDDRRSLAVFAIPAMVFCLGCFYVFGSLEHLHGARPSERTFLGVIPMLASINLTARILNGARLNGRLRRLGSPEPSRTGNLL